MRKNRNRSTLSLALGTLLLLMVVGCATRPVVIPGSVLPSLMSIVTIPGTGIEIHYTLERRYTKSVGKYLVHQAAYLPFSNELEIPPACMADEEDVTKCTSRLVIRMQVLNGDNIDYSLWADWVIERKGKPARHIQKLVSKEHLYAGYFEIICPTGRDDEEISIGMEEAAVTGRILFKNKKGEEMFSLPAQKPLKYMIMRRY